MVVIEPMATDNDQVGDHPDDVESVEEEENQKDINKLLNFHDVFTALKNQNLADTMASLPPDVRRRINALKKIQLDSTKIEAQFFKEVHELECKYIQQYVPLYKTREAIVTGAYEPTDDECKWALDEEEELSKDLKEKAVVADVKKEEVPAPVKGIPDFWLTVFRNVNLLADMLQEHDEPILKHLIDIKTHLTNEPMGFTLEFIFEPNEYFTNTVLTKEYDMKCEPDDDDPFSFEGPEIIKCRGCVINWNKGKDITKKTVKKKQKHKNRGVVRTVTKVVENDSFFNFFSPPTISDNINNAEVDEDVRNLVTSDFEIGHYIRDRVVPRAVLYYTGEAVEDNDDDYEEESEEEEDEESGDESDIKEGTNESCKQQ